MMKLIAKIELTTEEAINCANANFDNVQNNILTLKFKWTNKNTSVKSFESYVKNYLRNFSTFSRAYKINSLDLVES